MDMLERMQFHFATVTGYRVMLDFFNMEAKVDNDSIGYHLKCRFTRCRANFGTIEVIFDVGGVDVLNLRYGVDERYISQIQRFL